MSETTELKECRHPEHAQEPHPCPFQQDVWNDPDFRCTCCEDCTEQCAADI